MAANANPVPYIGTGGQSQTVLGHYSLGQRSGFLTATPLAAASVLASFRWAPANPVLLCVLMRLKVSIGVHTALTQADAFDVSGTIARAFTVDYSSNNTQANMGGATSTGAMRANMPNSQLGTKGPQICTTAGMTGATSVLDTDFANVTSLNLPGTTVGIGDSRTLYEWSALGQHPIVLNNNMGYVARNVTAGPSAGTCYMYFEWTWAEVFLF
jgi:hypothetical protein